MNLRVGVDIGGTFTDLVVLDDDSGAFAIGKTLTTHGDPSEAVERVLDETLAKIGWPIADVRHLVHGTTLVTNALIERKGATTALLTSEGFRDAVEIRREQRYELYDLELEMPRPLVPRHLRFDVPQRTRADGTSLTDLDEAFVRRLTRELVGAGVEAVAISFLHSFTNPADELRARELVLEEAPAIRVAISSEVAPEIREYERTSTTCCNVYVQERVERYLRGLERRLDRAGFTGSFFVMLSSGGIATVETASRFPIRLLESGPAAGALAAAHYGSACGERDLLSFDMGGTTAKLCVIDGGEPLLAHEFEVDRIYRFKKGSGLPVKVPVIEMIEIGAGGGSIARVDALGLLKVGPDSAGSEPGPVCYGRGGTQPCVTDADLVLGYLDPSFFLGGDMGLDLEACRGAIRAHIAEPLGLSVERAAFGIHQVVNENMANAARVHALERGRDPRRFPLFVFGGAGPVHGYGVARALGAPALIAPLGAGVMSTVGFLSAPLAFDFSRSLRAPLAGCDWPRVNALLADMQAEGEQILAASGVAAADVTHERLAELRYVGQGYEVRVPLPTGDLSDGSVAEITRAFERVYRDLYGRLGPPVPVEVMTWRVVSSGPRPSLELAAAASGRDATAAIKGVRPAWFAEADGYLETSVYDRYALGHGATFAGPAIVEERESTVVVGPGTACAIDAHLNLVVRWQSP